MGRESEAFFILLVLHEFAEPATRSVPVQKVAQDPSRCPSEGFIIWGQGKEGQGRPDDANGRYGGSFEIVILYKKKERAPPLSYNLPPIS